MARPFYRERIFCGGLGSLVKQHKSRPYGPMQKERNDS